MSDEASDDHRRVPSGKRAGTDERHEHQLRKEKDEQAIEDNAEFTFSRTVVVLKGPILCLGSIVLEVDKAIHVLSGRGPSFDQSLRAYIQDVR